jgi:alkyl hydroperoxide reductase subunit AhpC|tara:strand:+ start:315 stop:545 length:231 start_codon:yes stop_codon:yes gene_type:complete
MGKKTHDHEEWHNKFKDLDQVIIAESEDEEKLKNGVKKTLKENSKLKKITPIVFDKSRKVFKQVLGKIKNIITSIL